MEWTDAFAALVTGLVAGTIDSVAGGGGLVTLPVLLLLLGNGALAVGTNKIVGSTAAFVAFLVYRRGGHFVVRPSLIFGSWIALGSFLGSRCTRFIPPHWFAWMLLLTCPVILFIVYRRDFWVREAHQVRTRESLEALSWFEPSLALGGLACGFYDGAWGPGGGTFMFLTLFFAARLDLMHALAATKLVNTVSAGSALVSFAQQGLVHWQVGAVMATAVAVGALIGSQFAARGAARIVRPMLTVVVLLLLFKVLGETGAWATLITRFDESRGVVGSPGQ